MKKRAHPTVVQTRVRDALVLREDGLKDFAFIVEGFLTEEGCAGIWLAFANADGAIGFHTALEAVAFEELMRQRYGLDRARQEGAAA